MVGLSWGRSALKWAVEVGTIIMCTELIPAARDTHVATIGANAV